MTQITKCFELIGYAQYENLMLQESIKDLQRQNIELRASLDEAMAKISMKDLRLREITEKLLKDTEAA